MYCRLALAVVVSALTFGCESPPAELTLPVAGPSFDFTNGPSDLPNINFRGERRLFFAWPDFARDLAIIINAPADPGDLTACGGTEPPPDLVSVQRVGELQEVLKVLRLARDVSIFVYQPAPPTFADLCAATPIAHGTGNLTSTDNDLFLSLTRANAFGFRAQGTVELVSGGRAQVTAELQLLILPDGTFRVLAINVMLHPTR